MVRILSTLVSSAVLLALAPAARCAPLMERDASCPSYVIIEARGTGEPQGPSIGFRAMNAKILSTVPNGTDYPVVYPASPLNQVDIGVRDIIRKINESLSEDPRTCFVLQGYSQGASVVTQTMPQLQGAAFDAVKAAILIGDPTHVPGQECNVDGNGGDSTKDARGALFFLYKGTPSNWVSKTKDICLPGDGVCQLFPGVGTTPPHFLYGFDPSVQDLGSRFAISALT
ncbi:Cutinase [Pseudozyma hubeiensis]|nr:Cutinase [Pseudozyma hubeiensis]